MPSQNEKSELAQNCLFLRQLHNAIECWFRGRDFGYLICMNERQMPQTPEEWRRWLIEQATGDVQKIEILIKEAREQLKSGCAPAKKSFLSREIPRLQRIRLQARHDIKRWGG